MADVRSLQALFYLVSLTTAFVLLLIVIGESNERSSEQLAVRGVVQFQERQKELFDMPLESDDIQVTTAALTTELTTFYLSNQESETTTLIKRPTKDQKTLVLGVSTGRSGTLGFARLLNNQPHMKVSHEYSRCNNLHWANAKNRQLSKRNVQRRIEHYLSAPQPIVGDVASWLLPYLPYFIEQYPNIKIVGFKRNREDCLTSWDKWLAQWNHFMWIDNSIRNFTNFKHERKPQYVECFPHYNWPASYLPKLTVRDGSTIYYDQYFEVLDRYMDKWPDKFKFYDSYDILNDQKLQVEMLQWIGEPGPYNLTIPEDRRHNKNNKQRQRIRAKYNKDKKANLG